MRRVEVFVEVALIVIFALIVLLVLRSPVLAPDVEIERSIQALRATWLDPLTTAISWVGFPPQSTLIDALLVVIVFVVRYRWAAACAGLAAGGSAGLWFLIAPLVHRPRPTSDLVRVAAEIPFGSFPSGHVLNITAFFGFLAFLAIHLLAPGAWRALVVTVCSVLIVTIGFARIYSGEHWPTDVVAGYILGVIWLMPVIWLYRWGAGRWSRKPGDAAVRWERASP